MAGPNSTDMILQRMNGRARRFRNAVTFADARYSLHIHVNAVVSMSSCAGTRDMPTKMLLRDKSPLLNASRFISGQNILWRQSPTPGK
jgi:hypothetical protein